jgi:hypothetical protein
VPGSAGTLYAATGAGVFKTSDAGGSWVHTTAPTGWTEVVAVHPTVPSTVFAGTLQNGLFRSTDAGGSWAAVPGLPAATVNDIAFHPADPTILYAGVGGTGTPPGQPVVHRSTDGGATWQPWSNGILGVGMVRRVAVHPTATSTLYAAALGGFYRSTDGGATWASGFSWPATINDLALDPVVSTTLYAASGNGVHRSTDGGGNWTLIHSIPVGLQALGIAIHPTVPATFYAAFEGLGVHRSTDSGATWSPVNHGLAVRMPRRLAIDPAGSGTVFAAVDRGSVWQASPPVPVELVGFAVE